MISKQPTLVCFSPLTEDPFFFFIRNQGKSHSLEDLASPGSLHGGSKSPRLQRTMSVNQRSSPRSRFSVQENRFSFNNRGKSLKELSFRESKLHAIKWPILLSGAYLIKNQYYFSNLKRACIWPFILYHLHPSYQWPWKPWYNIIMCGNYHSLGKHPPSLPLLAAMEVLPGGSSAPQWQKFKKWSVHG